MPMDKLRIILWTGFLVAPLATISGQDICKTNDLARAKALLANLDPWMDDFEAAKARAAKEHKEVLVQFEGSDWCPWCKKLNEEIFSSQNFLREAQEKYVLVKIDFPKKFKLPEKTQEQNEGLSQKYKIDGLPSVVLMDAEGAAYKYTSYEEVSPENYLKMVEQASEEKQQRNNFLNQAERETGDQKAQMLAKAYRIIRSEEMEANFTPVREEIMKLDSENKLGLKTEILTAEYRKQIKGLLDEAANLDKDKTKQKTVLLKISDISMDYLKLKDLMPEERQRAWMNTAYAAYHMGEMDLTMKILQKAELLDPTGQNELTKRIKQFRKSITTTN
jgi:thioredoxin-related protein